VPIACSTFRSVLPFEVTLFERFKPSLNVLELLEHGRQNFHQCEHVLVDWLATVWASAMVRRLAFIIRIVALVFEVELQLLVLLFTSALVMFHRFFG
jgi:hypothetical protein